MVGWDTNGSPLEAGAPPPDLFIRRYAHSSTVLRDRVYIAGGQTVYWFNHSTINERRVTHFSNETVTIPLNESWSAETVDLSVIPNPTPDGAKWSPSMWSDEERNSIYIFGGAGWLLNPGGSTDPYNISVDARGEANVSPMPRSHSHWPAWGLSTSGNGYGYVFGRNYNYNVHGRKWFDFSSGDWSQENIQKDPQLSAWSNVPYPEGAAAFVPDFGTEGLVLLTNQTQQEHAGASKADALGSVFDGVTLYDPATQTYQYQETTGNGPSTVGMFCLSGVSSRNGTHELFFHGGFHVETKSVLPDSYILTLPGFHWFPVPQTSVSPRCSHSCNHVGNGQMLVIGGTDRYSSKYEFTVPDPNPQGLGVFNMQTLEWGTDYQHDGDGYEPPDMIANWYRENDWDSVNWASDEVQNLFKANDVDPFQDGFAKAASNPDSQASLSPGSIAGIVIGAVAVLLLIGLLIWRFSRRQHQRRLREREAHDAEVIAEKQIGSHPPSSIDSRSSRGSRGSRGASAGFHKPELDAVDIDRGAAPPELGMEGVDELDNQRGGRPEIADKSPCVEANGRSLHELPTSPAAVMVSSHTVYDLPEMEAPYAPPVPRDEKGEKTWFVDPDDPDERLRSP